MLHLQRKRLVLHISVPLLLLVVCIVVEESTLSCVFSISVGVNSSKRISQLRRSSNTLASPPHSSSGKVILNKQCRVRGCWY